MNLQPYDQKYQPNIGVDAAADDNNKEEHTSPKEEKELILVYIYNIPPWIKWRELKSFLCNFIKESTILHIQIWPILQENLTNAIISINSYDSSIEIFENLNNYEWNGFLLSVRIEYENEINPIMMPNNGFIPPAPIPHPGFQSMPPPPPQFMPAQQVLPYPNAPPPPPSQGPHSSGLSHPSSPTPYYNFIPTFFPYNQQQQIPPPGIQLLSPPPSLPPHLQPQQIHPMASNAYSYSPIASTPSNPLSRTSSSSMIYRNNNNPSSSSSPRLYQQPSRQITLRQLNYHDITDISEVKPPDKTRLFIGNIPFESDWRDLKDLLRSVGNIQRVEIPKLDNKSKGFGIAIFENEIDAKRAIELLDGVNFQGRSLTVRYDKFPRMNRYMDQQVERDSFGLKSVREISPTKDEEDGEGDKEQEISFDDGEFAKEARSLVESLNINK